MTRSIASRSEPSKAARMEMPAEQSSTSRRPKRSTVAATARRHCSRPGPALVAWRVTPGRAQPADQPPAAPEKPAAKGLPLAQVILFSSGVGYFQREGTVEGNARVDLSFPAADVNDLLKSLVLEDRGE